MDCGAWGMDIFEARSMRLNELQSPELEFEQISMPGVCSRGTSTMVSARAMRQQKVKFLTFVLEMRLATVLVSLSVCLA